MRSPSARRADGSSLGSVSFPFPVNAVIHHATSRNRHQQQQQKNKNKKQQQQRRQKQCHQTAASHRHHQTVYNSSGTPLIHSLTYGTVEANRQHGNVQRILTTARRKTREMRKHETTRSKQRPTDDKAIVGYDIDHKYINIYNIYAVSRLQCGSYFTRCRKNRRGKKYKE